MDHSFDIARMLWNKTAMSERAAFFTGLIVGVITHLYTMTNKLPNWDELSIGFDGGGYYLGRFLSNEYHFLFSWFSSPGVNGFLTIFFLALTAAMVVRITRVHSVTGGALIGVMLVTFPSVCSSMTYMFVAPGYALAIMIITLAVLVTRRYRFGCIAAVVLIVLSMASYQAYFPFATALFVLALIADLADGREDKAIIREGCKDLITLAAGMVSYFVCLKLLKVELANYRGLNDIGSASVGQYVRAILRAYHRMLEYFVTNPPSYAQETAHKWNLVVVVLLAVLVILTFLRKELRMSRMRMFMYLVFTAIMPLAMGLIYVMSVEVDNASPLMIYPYCLLYVWLIVLAERVGTGLKWQQVLSAVCVVALFMVGYTNYRVTSDSYYRMYIANQRISGFYNRIIARLEEQEGFEYGDKIHICGNYSVDGEFPLDTYKLYDYKYEDLEGVTLESHLFMEPTREYYLRLFLGIDTPRQQISEEDLEEIKATEEYQEMPTWPAEGCIARINDVWIVKMSND